MAPRSCGGLCQPLRSRVQLVDRQVWERPVCRGAAIPWDWRATGPARLLLCSGRGPDPPSPSPDEDNPTEFGGSFVLYMGDRSWDRDPEPQETSAMQRASPPESPARLPSTGSTATPRRPSRCLALKQGPRTIQPCVAKRERAFLEDSTNRLAKLRMVSIRLSLHPCTRGGSTGSSFYGGSP